MTRVEALPDRVTYLPGQPITVELRGVDAAGEATVWALGDALVRRRYDGSGSITFDGLPEGGYGVEIAAGETVVRTAVEVTATPGARQRYGFVVDYSPERASEGLSDTVRRLHLTDVQFYDWAYRHADLLGGGQHYLDALDQPISLDTVSRLAAAVQNVGSRALGYAAVYAVGPAEWQKWEHRALLTPEGPPYGLGDFLFLVDPAAPDWLQNFGAQLQEAVDAVGFDGFHLDQYGYPKRATTPEGRTVEVGASFVSMIESVRSALPQSRLVFNNVNDFPTWLTGRSPQDALYIEVWHPHDTLATLGAVVARARSAAGALPIVIAAYQHVYDSAPASAADIATSLTMATLFSHGATQLLAGEADRVLVDPYYVRNHVVEESTALMLKRWYDFLVEHDRLLLDPAIIDVTGSYAGAYNDDCDVKYADASVNAEAVAGEVWRRVTLVEGGLVMHLINLVGQVDTLWDSARAEPRTVGGGSIRIRRDSFGLPRVQVADPDDLGRLVDAAVKSDGDWAIAELPPLALWQVVYIRWEGRTS